MCILIQNIKKRVYTCIVYHPTIQQGNNTELFHSTGDKIPETQFDLQLS